MHFSSAQPRTSLRSLTPCFRVLRATASGRKPDENELPIAVHGPDFGMAGNVHRGELRADANNGSIERARLAQE
jgi:hypothetical protein